MVAIFSSEKGLVIRKPEAQDVFELGLFMHRALEDAPSSQLEAGELNPDLEHMGQYVLAQSLFGNESQWLVERGNQLLGLFRFLPKEFLRARHVGQARILVLREHRQEGIGAFLLKEGLERVFSMHGIERVEMQVADDDVALLALLASSSYPWRRERLATKALYVDGHYVDLGIWVTDAHALPL